MGTFSNRTSMERILYPVYRDHTLYIGFESIYAALGIFGKTAVHESLKLSSAYLDDLGLNTGSLRGV